MATAMPPPRRWLAPARGCAELAGLLRRSAEAALQHDALTLAQATAYSAIVALFPALIVAAAAMSLLPDTLPFRFQLALFFDLSLIHIYRTCGQCPGWRPRARCSPLPR